jgi:hypothetical protein
MLSRKAFMKKTVGFLALTIFLVSTAQEAHAFGNLSPETLEPKGGLVQKVVLEGDFVAQDGSVFRVSHQRFGMCYGVLMQKNQAGAWVDAGVQRYFPLPSVPTCGAIGF